MAGVERRLVILRLEADHWPAAPGAGSFVSMSALDGYGPEWRLASHTVTAHPADGAMVVTCSLERRD